MDWVSAILSSGTSSILLNGIPGKKFACKCGVRQGDPLSPLLYLFGSDLLQSAVNELLHQGGISLPILSNDPDFPIVQYADDTLLIMPAERDQLLALKSVLDKFSVSTGLKINYCKSQMVPINVPDNIIQQLASDFGCQIGAMPFTYLGLPLGTTRPRISELMPLVCRLERRLTSSSCFLSQGARVQLINSALASMPLHFLCSLQLPPGLTNQLDRILRQCLWREWGGSSDTNKKSLAAWDMVCKPKKCGGLGIVNFQKKNAALLIKHLDKFYNREDLPWVELIWHAHYVSKIPHAEGLCGSFWWRDVMKLVDNFREVVSIQPGRGDTFLFWSDKWILAGSDQPIKERYPRLYSYALDNNLSAAEVFALHDQDFLPSIFHLPLSRLAYEELSQLQFLLSSNPITDQKDVWTYRWGEKYSSSKFYALIHQHLAVPAVYHWLWKSSCIMKTKVFAWLLLSDRLNTKNLLLRRNWKVTEDYSCVLCPTQSHEDRLHLFFGCTFSQRIWNYLQIDWVQSDDLQTVVSAAKRSFGQPFFMEVMITACWNIWLQRNGKIFRWERPSFSRWRSGFVHDLSLLRHRLKAKHLKGFLAWIDSLP